MRDIKKIDLSQKPAAISKDFKAYSRSDIKTIDEHKLFIDKLAIFRTNIKEYTAQNGTNFLQFLRDMLSVGEDGLYSNKLRFIYELIQNVDDCNYLDTDKCELDIKFDWNVGHIILTYNETGFEPAHVFSITGIAEKAKNISSGKVEIGEKGVGFKSVFGIADSVLIQSGKFSFELYKDDFTIPVPYYGENFEEVEGTKLTLRVGAKKVKTIYSELVKLYSSNVSILNNNPILCLNKLTKLRFYCDAFRYINFSIINDLSDEKDNVFTNNIVTVAIDIKNYIDGFDHLTVQNKIVCNRYKMPIVYDKLTCASRYGNEIAFDEKKHNLIAYVPVLSELEKFSNLNNFGWLYSFLPTQVKMTVPFIIHAPYKLDGSREFIDPQEEGNEWFHFTNNKLSKFLCQIYADLAVRLKEDIVEYLPKSQYFLDCNNSDKLERLKVKILSAKILKNEKLFYTEDKTFETASGVVAFSLSENIVNPIELYLLLDLKKPLFLPKRKVDMNTYGVQVVVDAYANLFCRAVNDPTITADALSLLTLKNDFDFEKAIKAVGAKKIVASQVESLCNCKSFLAAFQKCAIERIKKNMRPAFTVDGPMTPLNSENSSILSGAIEDTSFGKDGEGLLQYINLIRRNYHTISSLKKEVFFPCGNVLIVSEDEPISSFASFVENFVGKAFVASLRLRQESEKLNTAISDEAMTNVEFFSLLQGVRRSLITILGKKGYSNYIQIINKSCSDPKRFINELLQNADDCEYSSTHEPPAFSCTFNASELSTSYNEDGFSRVNVRSITAIGESTKKQIQSGSSCETIGEKGVGFKSVFGVASEVSIHSNGFDFKLIDEEPTVPRKAEIIKGLIGTKMIFKLREPIPPSSFTDDEVLALCLCLRKLKKVKIGKYTVDIEDSNLTRTIDINGNKYKFTRFEYAFVITDAEAISERENKQRIINPNQTIRFYLPEDKTTSNKIENYNLYSGLPTLIQTSIPLIIDAPFEVTTSREGVLQGLWNAIIREEVYNALVEMLHSIKSRSKVKVFSYIKVQGIFEDEWLNNYPLQERLSSEALIPLIDGSFVASNQKDCWIYTDFCRYLFKNKMSSVPHLNIVSSAQYADVLVWLGCKWYNIQDFIDAIEEAVQRGNITNETFRKKLYPALKLHAQQKTIRGDTVYKNKLSHLEIIPVKPKQDAQILYVTANEKIYSSSDPASTDEYFLLAENLLSTDDFYEIFGKPILPLDDSQKRQLYRDRLVALLNDSDIQRVAELLLAEFNNNRLMFELCKNELKGQIERVPVMFCNGEYYRGNKFIHGNDTRFFGEITNSLLVAARYQAFAQFLGCSSLQSIHYDDIDVNVIVLVADDIEDFWHGGFLYRFEIIQGFMSEGKIPDELVERYSLEGMDSRESPTSEFDFPSNPIADLSRIRHRILSAQLNEITVQEIKELKRVPAFSYDKAGYVLNEYNCDDDVCACQMCKGFMREKYIEANAIQYEPQYAWEQMQLCLCLNCSKDFEALRRNKDIQTDFLTALSDADIDDDGPIAVPIGNREMFFTSTHLAEIQAIIRRQNDNILKIVKS